ncbi:unnamed protein product, partial [Acidithrix sp. C25]
VPETRARAVLLAKIPKVFVHPSGRYYIINSTTDKGLIHRYRSMAELKFLGLTRINLLDQSGVVILDLTTQNPKRQISRSPHPNS